jgi:DNA-binding protein H-NS
MKRAELERMDVEELWALHVEISSLLQKKIQQEKLVLEERLRRLLAPASGRRPYPPVNPKYRNPDQPSETWTGRGKQPRWLVAQLTLGKRIDDFRIRRAVRAKTATGERAN